ncbi:uncharacterized protein LOC143019602 isoform X2 [Oratosquilla oratoria]|uniref:uncharacterized protein LOC143019602 isoform X2 n=1 Tax=Oratosquilla oratoria TaxID=337810 RepID=UPI003F75D4D6
MSHKVSSVATRQQVAYVKGGTMSTQVTVHRMMTTSVTSAILLNTGLFKTVPGILKVLQVALGCVTVGIAGHYINYTVRNVYSDLVPELLFLLVATTCLITTALLLFACIFSIATAGMLPKTLFESMYHIVAFILYLSASIVYLVYLQDNKRVVGYYETKIAAAAIGLVLTLLYLISAAYSVRSYRRG